MSKINQLPRRDKKAEHNWLSYLVGELSVKR